MAIFLYLFTRASFSSKDAPFAHSRAAVAALAQVAGGAEARAWSANIIDHQLLDARARHLDQEHPVRWAAVVLLEGRSRRRTGEGRASLALAAMRRAVVVRALACAHIAVGTPGSAWSAELVMLCIAPGIAKLRRWWSCCWSGRARTQVCSAE